MRQKKLIALVSCLLFGWMSHSTYAESLAPDYGEESRRMKLLLETRLTHIDFDGDGEDDVIREYDQTGLELLSFTSIEKEEDGSILEEVIDLKAGQQEHIQTVTAIDPVSRKRKWLETITEKFYPNGARKTLEHVFLDEVDGKKKRELQEFFEEETKVTTFKDARGRWVKEGESESLPRYLVKDRSAKQPKLSAMGKQYVTCLQEKDPARPGSCDVWAASVDPIANFVKLAPHYSSLTCEHNNQVFTPSGFRMDLGSCKEEAAQVRLENAMRKVTEEKMSCLAGINKNFAGDCTKSFLKNRPLVICAQSQVKENGMQQFLDEMCPSGKAKCLKETEDLYNRTGGFYDPKHASHIYLTGTDPGIKDEWTNSHQEALEQTLFHEMLHACGHNGSKNHNHPHFSDEVYGCEAMCGGDTSQLTREGCIACVSVKSVKKGKAKFKKVSQDDKKFCGQFPPEEVIRKLVLVNKMRDSMDSCHKAALASDACYLSLTHLLGEPYMQGVCGKLPASKEKADKDWSKTCAAKIRAVMAKNIVQAAVIAKGENSSLVDAIASYSTGASKNLTVERNANGKLEIKGEDTSGCRQNKMIYLFFNTISVGYCQELQNVKDDKEEKALRESYEKQVAVIVPYDMPVLSKKPSENLNQALERCKAFGAEDDFSRADYLLQQHMDERCRN